MKHWLMILSCLTAFGVLADPPSVHGMLIFGKSKIYASHLPMFHRPHDYQVVIELKLPEDITQLFLNDQKTHPNQMLYTLVPEPFILPDMIKSPRPFSATLFRGHFERDGQEIAQIKNVQIQRVILNRKLDPKAFQPPFYQAYVFGTNEEHYAIHLIFSRPSFDQVLRLEFSTSSITGFTEGTMSLGQNRPDTPLQVGFFGQGENATQQIYLELGDLK